MDLYDDTSPDRVRFQLPVCIATRYGAMPSGMVGAAKTPANRVQIAINVYTKSFDYEVTSPSHAAFVMSQGFANRTSLPFHGEVGTLTSSTFMDRDFVLIVRSADVSASRCLTERSPSGSVAMQLTVIPSLTLPTIPAQEYIFLVDRSGSMMTRLRTAKTALVMLLRALPVTGTIFNIFSFGDWTTSLWPESKPYNSETLDEAVRPGFPPW